jgi:hypothetical protein
MKILGGQLFTIGFYIGVFFTVFWALHFLTGWSPSLHC